MRLYKKIMDMSIRWKLFWCIFMATMIPIGLLGVYASHSTEETLRNQSYANMQEKLAQACKNLEMTLAGYENASSIIFMNKEIQDYINVDFSDYGYAELYYYVRQFMGELSVVNEDVSSFGIYTTNQTVPPDYVNLYEVTEEVAEEKWYQRAVEASGKPVFIGTTKNEKNELMFSLVRSLDYYNWGPWLNVLKMDMKENQLYGLISETADEDEMMILDEEGRIISGRDKSLIGGQFDQAIEVVEEDRANEEVIYENNRMLLREITVNNGWRIVSLTSVANIDAMVHKGVWNVVYVAFVALACSLIFSNLMARLITSRIHKLSKAVKRMKQGIMGEPILLEGKDEIGVLADTFSEMSVKVDSLIKEVYEKELIRKAAELNLLQEQINPHFLYNALSSVNAMALRSGNQNIMEMIGNLAEFYRISLNKGRNIVTVQEEVDLLKCYLKIQQVRFEDRLQVQFDLQEDLLTFTTIKLILQPIVENAIHHGFREGDSILHITVRLREVEEQLVFTITDDGVGMEQAVLADLNSEIQHAVRGYGLKNVAIRLQLQYNQQNAVKVESMEGRGTVVHIKIPKNK